MDLCDVDAENHSSPVQYPKLPMDFPLHASTNRLQPSPSLVPAHRQDDCSVTSVKSNTSRRRTHKISDLINSPPRASHATQVSRYFTQSAVTAARPRPQLKREDSRHSFHSRSDSASPADRNSQTPSQQTPERPIPARIHIPQLDGAGSVPVTPVRISSLRGPAPTFTPRSSARPTPTRKTPSRASSSDSWTGDDEFLPPKAQLRENKVRHEQQRLQRQQAKDNELTARTQARQQEQDAFLAEEAAAAAELDTPDADSASDREAGDHRGRAGKPNTPAVDEKPIPPIRQTMLKAKNTRFGGRSAAPKKKKKKNAASLAGSLPGEQGTALVTSNASTKRERRKKVKVSGEEDKKRPTVNSWSASLKEDVGQENCRGDLDAYAD